jgi:hypothetical protein
MKSDTLELLRGQPGPKVEIGGPQAPKLPEGNRYGNFVVLKYTRPLILVIAGQRGPILGEHHPDPVPHDHVAVREMLNHLEDRPLTRSFRSP